MLHASWNFEPILASVGIFQVTPRKSKRYSQKKHGQQQQQQQKISDEDKRGDVMLITINYINLFSLCSLHHSRPLSLCCCGG